MSVKLRMKNLSGGRKSLYLDIYHKGKRDYDFLELVLEDEFKVKKESNNDMILLSKRIKEANREKILLAETIRANRETELQFASHDVIPSFKRNADFVLVAPVKKPIEYEYKSLHFSTDSEYQLARKN